MQGSREIALTKGRDRIVLQRLCDHWHCPTAKSTACHDVHGPRRGLSFLADGMRWLLPSSLLSPSSDPRLSLTVPFFLTSFSYVCLRVFPLPLLLPLRYATLTFWLVHQSIRKDIKGASTLPRVDFFSPCQTHSICLSINQSISIPQANL